jgi:hypothetical protein
MDYYALEIKKRDLIVKNDLNLVLTLNIGYHVTKELI